MKTVKRQLITIALFGTLLTATVAGNGCARVSTNSEVRVDGSMTRTVTYSGTSPEPQKTADGGTVTTSAEISMSPRLEDLIALPTAAGGWKVTRTRDDKSNVVVTASKEVAPGQIVRNDFGIRLPRPKAGEGAAVPTPAKPPVRTAQKPAASTLLLENTATVRQIAPGRLEYREVLHWRGPRPKELDTPDTEMLTALRRALPPSLANDAPALKQVGIALQRELWKTLFGPGDPILPLIVFHQDLAEYRIRKQLRDAVLRSLTSVYGSRLSAQDMNTAVARLSSEVASDATRKTQAKKDAGPGSMSAEAGGESSNTPIALLVRVKMPGKVTDTNGELDPDTNEVVWPLYSEAAAIGDITLTATTDVSPSK